VGEILLNTSLAENNVTTDQRQTPLLATTMTDSYPQTLETPRSIEKKLLKGEKTIMIGL